MSVLCMVRGLKGILLVRFDAAHLHKQHVSTLTARSGGYVTKDGCAMRRCRKAGQLQRALCGHALCEAAHDECSTLPFKSQEPVVRCCSSECMKWYFFSWPMTELTAATCAIKISGPTWTWLWRRVAALEMQQTLSVVLVTLAIAGVRYLPMQSCSEAHRRRAQTDIDGDYECMFGECDRTGKLGAHQGDALHRRRELRGEERAQKE